MHVCVSKLTIICSDNGLAPGRRQAIILTNAGILLIGPLGTNVTEILIAIYHYDDVIMTTLASQITSLTVVYSIVYSDADQIKHQSSASLAFVRDRWISRTNGQLRGKCFHLITSSCTFSLKKMHLKMSSGKWRPFCLGLNVLMGIQAKYGAQTITHAWAWSFSDLDKEFCWYNFSFKESQCFSVLEFLVITTYITCSYFPRMIRGNITALIPGDACTRQWTWSSLVLLTAGRGQAFS